MKQVKALNPANYERHLIHGAERTWAETNCYVDVLVELLHGLGYEPIAALPFTLRIDFEGDQWSFFKFPHEDLFALYGLEIQEFNPWLSLVQHVETQVGLRSEEHTSELQSRENLVCRLLLEKKKMLSDRKS